MEHKRYLEMKNNLEACIGSGKLSGCDIILFAHCEATQTLADELMATGIKPVAILDNSPEKMGITYQDIPVCAPEISLEHPGACVLIVSRFYEQMAAQLKKLGFKGEIIKLVDYNPFAEYSLSKETFEKKKERALNGELKLNKLKKLHTGSFFVFCPFCALGDVYFCMSYLKHFLDMIKREKCVVCVVGKGCAQVVNLFNYTEVETFDQGEMDDLLQGVIYSNDKDSYIAHQDRPYVVDLHRALYKKCIPLETIYCCGVFGLPKDTVPVEPVNWKEYENLEAIPEHKAVILSPYAKSVTALNPNIWKEIVSEYSSKGYTLFTNVSEDEKPLEGTQALKADLKEMKSILEKAGVFVGIRSGLCDVIRSANCKKTALYPDYNYSDTKWKAIDMYSIAGFTNIVVGEEYKL